jgi:hypothetical protein
MLLRFGTETQIMNPVDYLPQVIPTLYPVLQLTEYLPDIILNGIGNLLRGLELLEVGRGRT